MASITITVNLNTSNHISTPLRIMLESDQGTEFTRDIKTVAGAATASFVIDNWDSVTNVVNNLRVYVQKNFEYVLDQGYANYTFLSELYTNTSVNQMSIPLSFSGYKVQMQ